MFLIVMRRDVLMKKDRRLCSSLKSIPRLNAHAVVPLVSLKVGFALEDI